MKSVFPGVVATAVFLLREAPAALAVHLNTHDADELAFLQVGLQSQNLELDAAEAAEDAQCKARNLASEDEDPLRIYDGHQLLNVSSCGQANIAATAARLREQQCRVLNGEGAFVAGQRTECLSAAVVCPKDPHSDAQDAFTVDMIHHDAGAMLRKRSGGRTQPLTRDGRSMHRLGADDGPLKEFYESYRGLCDLEKRMRQVKKTYKEQVEQIELSEKSHEGRTIYGMRLRGEGYESGKTRVFINSLQHAREWITGMCGMYVVEKSAKKLKGDPSWLNNTELVFVPVSNPDGFVHTHKGDRFWRKNRRPLTKKEKKKNSQDSYGFEQDCSGVDTNRNWDKEWNGATASSDKCEEIFIGDEPFSEPESRALKTLFKEAPVDVAIDVHSFSELILGSWVYGDVKHPRLKQINKLGNKLKKALNNANGEKYKFGTGDCNGELYYAGGVMGDWTSANGALGYTIELRPNAQNANGVQGFMPDESEIAPTCKELWAATKAAVKYAQNHHEESVAANA